MPKLRLASSLQRDSIVDGPGLRMVVWTQGCPHNCPGCHNPQTHSFDGGELVEVSELCNQIKEAKLQNGITLSGGDPFMQAEELVEVVKVAKEKKLNVWAYTGFLFEDLIKKEDALALLKYVDVLVDGPFIETQKNVYLNYKGSKNQRIINVQNSLKQGMLILSEYDKENENINV